MLLDNFYIIEEQVKSLRRDLTKEVYAKLPVLDSGHLKGYARIYSIALELLSHTDGRIDEKVLVNYIKHISPTMYLPEGNCGLSLLCSNLCL